MTMNRCLTLIAAVGLASLSTSALGASHATTDDHGAQGGAEGHISYANLVAKHSPAIVSVKFVMKGEMGELESECQGVIVEGDGLIIVSNIQIGGLAARSGNAVTPSDFKVLIGDDTQGVDATIIARDSDLQLAWLRIKEPKGTYPVVDFAASKDPAMGDPIYVLGQMGKFFDRVPVAIDGFVAAITAKPRKLFIPSVTLAGAEWGLPAFNAAGEPVGIVTVIVPDDDEAQGPGGMDRIFRGVQNFRMVLPGADVASATKKAKETAAAAPAEPAATDAPATPAAPAGEGAKPETTPAMP
jgi:hypothetical protein